MKIISICAATLAVMSLLNQRTPAAETNETNAVVAPAIAAEVTLPTNSAMSDLEALIKDINEKTAPDKTNESDFADDIKQFDVLLARHKDAKPEERAQILLMKAQFFIKVAPAPEKALAAFKQFKQEFPNVQLNGGSIDDIIDELQHDVTNTKIRRTLVPGAPFPTFSETDIAGKPLALTNYLGKVVLVDFWATWCMPCLADLPNVQKTYAKYHDKGLEIIGVSLDVERPKLEHFIKDNKMPWQQYNDGQFWQTKLATNYAVTAIPATFLIDRKGRIIASNLHGDEIEKAVAFATMPWVPRHLVAAGRSIDAKVRNYPYQSLGIIFVAGLILGFCTKRKNPRTAETKPTL